jgi:hypothetical protein
MNHTYIHTHGFKQFSLNKGFHYNNNHKILAPTSNNNL